MELQGFEEYLKSEKLSIEQIDTALNLVKRFDEFLFKYKNAAENANYDDLHNFSAYLIENEENTYINYVNLLRFAHFKKNAQLIQATLELLDGREVINNFSERLMNEFGDQVRNEIFKDIKLPPLGLHPKKKPGITKELVERLIAKIGLVECENFLAKGLRDKYIGYYLPERERFLKTKNIDDFLKDSHENLIETLKKHQEEKSLFYTQEIDEKVISYVKCNPSIEAGIRKGNHVIITKIPYMTRKYLNETNEKKKRYYYCHCPWIREALKEEAESIPQAFCNCSAGYYKNYWEAVLEHPVKVELLESVVKGDKVCKFVLHLPQDVL